PSADLRLDRPPGRLLSRARRHRRAGGLPGGAVGGGHSAALRRPLRAPYDNVRAEACCCAARRSASISCATTWTWGSSSNETWPPGTRRVSIGPRTYRSHPSVELPV